MLRSADPKGGADSCACLGEHCTLRWGAPALHRSEGSESMTAASEARDQAMKQDDALQWIAVVVQNQCFCPGALFAKYI